jgi:hypothetical protein
MHPFEELLFDREAAIRSDHGIDAASGTKRGLPNALFFIDPFFNLTGWKDRKAIKTSASVTVNDLFTALGRMLVGLNMVGLVYQGSSYPDGG